MNIIARIFHGLPAFICKAFGSAAVLLYRKLPITQQRGAGGSPLGENISAFILSDRSTK
jgi:hypothetical protein